MKTLRRSLSPALFAAFVVLFSLCLAVPLAVAEETKLIKPLEAVEQSGGFAISDGSSFFSFSKDGRFESGPIGISGRTMKGRWAQDRDGRFVATAELGWVNGLSALDQWCRVVFHISHLIKRGKDQEIRPGFGGAEEIYDSYFLIVEMTAVAKPEPQGEENGK